MQTNGAVGVWMEVPGEDDEGGDGLLLPVGSSQAAP